MRLAKDSFHILHLRYRCYQLMGSNPYSLATSKIFCNFCPAYCCYRLEGSILLITAEDINRIGRHLHIPDGQVRRQFLEGKNTFKNKEDGSCIFLADGRISKRCTIHSARPRQCRDFPYDNPCPYLECEDLLTVIEPRIEKSLGLKQQDRNDNL